MLLVPGHDELRVGRQGTFEDPAIRRVVLDHGHGFRRLVYGFGDPPSQYYRRPDTGYGRRCGAKRRLPGAQVYRPRVVYGAGRRSRTSTGSSSISTREKGPDRDAVGGFLHGLPVGSAGWQALAWCVASWHAPGLRAALGLALPAYDVTLTRATVCKHCSRLLKLHSHSMYAA